MMVLLLLAALYTVGNNIADPDLWGHVQYGRDVLRDGMIHPTTTYSFTANGYRWINHENISEILMAGAVDMFGIWGLQFGKFLLAASIFIVILRCAVKNGLGASAAGMVVMLVAANLAFHWSFRPQLLSFFCCTLMLWILNYSFSGWQEHYLRRIEKTDAENQGSFDTKRLKLLWLMPAVLCLWANSHGGFVAGVGIYLAYLGGRTVEALYFRRSAAFGIVKRFVLMGVVGMLGTLINPYGPGLLQWLASSLIHPRPEINDWHPVGLLSANGTRLLLAVALVAIAFAFSKRKRDWTHIVIMTLVLWQSLEHVRHIAFFALLLGFWIPPHLASLLQQAKRFGNSRQPDESLPRHTGLLRAACAIGFVVLVSLCMWRMSDLRVEKQEYPVSAFQFIADRDLDGRMVVTFNWAQYAIAAFGGRNAELPYCPVAFDGRFDTCYPQEIVDMHFDFVIGDQGPGSRYRSPNSPPIDDTRALHFGQPELVLISRRQKPSVRVMESNTDRWALLYQDELAQVWGLKSRFDDPNSPDYLPPELRRIGEEPQTGSVTWPALPTVAEAADLNRLTASVLE